MELPWVKEVRAARRLAERAHQARLVLEELLVLDKQQELLRQTPSAEGLDGSLQDALKRARELIHPAELEEETGMTGSDSVGTASDAAIREALRALASEQESAATALHELQHRQQHDLADPRYAEQTDALRRVWDERAEIGEELPMAERQSAVLGPVLSVVEQCLSSLEVTLQGDAETARLVSARTMEESVRSLAGIMDAVSIEHRLPSVITWADTESPTSEQLAGAMEALRQFEARYREMANGLSARVLSLQTRDAKLQAVLLERLG